MTERESVDVDFGAVDEVVLAAIYVDAFQAVRSSLFGEILEADDVS